MACKGARTVTHDGAKVAVQQRQVASGAGLLTKHGAAVVVVEVAAEQVHHADSTRRDARGAVH
jgi:2-C-methyl-D-erythritol 4-phosphate cytidylyltransferase